MNKTEAGTILNKLRTARDASNWEGKFTSEIRSATLQHRLTNIAEPLDIAIKMVEHELERLRNRSKVNRKAQRKAERDKQRPTYSQYADK
ncbi:hypothetical protein [Xanthomonas phage XAJ2]|uniref:Uncharacterized protein n=1 Tax=Xanthomonas phage XAJ2 TaxID=1775249 RepID=A0A1I9L2J0_9CAUD|nr:hypothetical protein [Xanthomonas phage XAJ2]